MGDTTLTVTQLVGAIIFALASIIGWLNGKIAHARDLVTNFNKFADPLTDKMLVITAFIMLADQGKAPGWVVATIVCRELAVTDLRLLLVEHGETMATAWLGKVKTTIRMAAVTLLFVDNISLNLISIPVNQIILYARLIFTICSDADYFVKNSDVFKGPMQVPLCGWLDSSVLDKVKII